MLKFNYCRDGQAISDMACEKWVKCMYNNSNIINNIYTLDVSTQNVIYAARTLIKEGVLDFDKVEFLYEGESLGKADKYGKLSVTVDGFADIFEDFLCRLIDVY
jgi:hypothetical protein